MSWERRQPDSDKAPPLTPRELELLRLTVLGYQNKEMACRMEISIKTVEKHRQQVYRKLKVNSAMAAARVAIRTKRISLKEWLSGQPGENVWHDAAVAV